MATHAPSLRNPAREQDARRLRGIYVILNEDDAVVERARAVVDGGVRIVQYRAKKGINAEHLGCVRKLTRERGALLIVNDDWHAALDYDCDGAHLGPGDDGFSDIARVRAAFGQRLIGLSCGTLDEVLRANDAGADYLGIGSVYATASKFDAGEPIGIEGLRRLARVTALPVAAVGGIRRETLPQVRASGVEMAAVISAIAAAEDPERAARVLVSLWNAGA